MTNVWVTDANRDGRMKDFVVRYSSVPDIHLGVTESQEDWPLSFWSKDQYVASFLRLSFEYETRSLKGHMQRKISKSQNFEKIEDKYLQNRYAKRLKSQRTLNPCFYCPKSALFNSDAASRMDYRSCAWRNRLTLTVHSLYV